MGVTGKLGNWFPEALLTELLAEPILASVEVDLVVV